MAFRILKIGNKEYKIRYTTNIMCSIEKLGKCSVSKLFDVGEFIALRLLLWGGLQPLNKDITIEGAGDLIDTYVQDGGNLGDLSDTLKAAMGDGGFMAKKEIASDEDKDTEEDKDSGE